MLGLNIQRPRPWVQALVLLAAAIAVALWLGGYRRNVPVTPALMQPEQGAAFVIPVSPPAWPLISRPDTLDSSYASRLNIFEDEKRLGPQHAGHDTVRSPGHGAYSHWEGSLLFSTSDGSDPRTNGRTYTASERIYLSWTVGFPALVIALLIMAQLVPDLWRLMPKNALRIYQHTGLRWVVHNVVPGVLISFAIAAILAAGAELYARAAFPFVEIVIPGKFLPDVGLVFAPNATLRFTILGDFSNEDRTNSIGFLDREPPSGPPREGVCRIAFIGDSRVEAMQVPTKDKFHVVFEQSFNEQFHDFRIETFALARSGTGQINQIPFYDHYARPLRPHVVVLVIVNNDLANNSALLEAIHNGWHPLHAPSLFAKRDPSSGQIDFQAIDPDWQSHLLPPLLPRPVLLRPLHRALTDKSFAYRWMYSSLSGSYPRAAMAISGEPTYEEQMAWRIAALRSDRESAPLMTDLKEDGLASIDSDFSNPDPLPPVFQEAIAFTDFGLSQWAERAQRDGVKLLALTIDAMANGNPDATSRHLERFQALLRKHAIDEIDQAMFANMRGYALGDGVWRHDPNHWNALGHRRTAELLVDYFSKHPEICRPNAASLRMGDGVVK
jgi:hypothetical protein